MIDVYFWATSNGYKPVLFLEEAKIPYRLIPDNLSKGQQFDPDFLKISPNHHIPAIIDNDPADKGAPISVFESAAILIYLAEKYGQFLPNEPRERKDVLEWLAWQVSALGPTSGQIFYYSSKENNPAALAHYQDEFVKLYAILNKRLEGRDYLAGDYSIADIACYALVARMASFNIDMSLYPNIGRWFDSIAKRPAVIAAYEKGVKLAAENQ